MVPLRLTYHHWAHIALDLNSYARYGRVMSSTPRSRWQMSDRNCKTLLQRRAARRQRRSGASRACTCASRSNFDCKQMQLTLILHWSRLCSGSQLSGLKLEPPQRSKHSSLTRRNHLQTCPNAHPEGNLDHTLGMSGSRALPWVTQGI